MVVESRQETRALFEREGTLPEFLDALRWRWKTIVLIAAFFTVGAAVSVESLPSEYDGHAVVSFAPRPNVPGAGADVLRTLVPKYVAYVTADPTVVRIAPTVNEDPGELENAVNASIRRDTGILDIVVRRNTPERAAAAANAFAAAAVRFSRNDRLLQGQVVARALPDNVPAAPPRRLLEGAALVVGLLLGIAVSLLLERGQPRLRSWRDIARVTGYPVVGRVPASRALRSSPSKAFSDPGVGSAFRILRANLEPQLRDGTIDLIAITSPSAGDGKTTVSALFAEALGRLGMKVLLVDGDLRRPGVDKIAKVETGAGLSHLLREDGRLNSSVKPGWSTNLWVLPTASDPEAGDLLARHFSAVMAEALEQFDVIIVDAPPLLGTDDARTISSIAKGVLLVTAVGTTESSVNEALLTLEALNAPLLGIVANRTKQSEKLYEY